MELYIIIALCCLLLVIMGVALSERGRRLNTKHYLENEIKYWKNQTKSEERELKASKNRETNLIQEVREAYDTIEKLKVDKLKYKTSAIPTLTSSDLKQQLRFKLPNGDIANTVRIKTRRANSNGKEIIGIEATVRKKEKGKFTNVEVEPVIESA